MSKYYNAIRIVIEDVPGLLVATLLLLVVTLALGMALIIQESPQDAYERGCTDRDSLWITTMQDVTDRLGATLDGCILEVEWLLADTLPAVEE